MAAAVSAVLAWAMPAGAGELRLIMFDQPGCIYCARWDAEIGPIYPSTDEAQIAPLTRMSIHDDLPEGIALDRPAVLTPTFVLLDDGRESGRLEGYAGDEFFWFLLGELIDGAQAPQAGAAGANEG
ncbi:MAG: thioredoxin family protein [Maritimibacter sp.]|nr:thioredoxin family protein [Maritimibacter sp.]